MSPDVTASPLHHQNDATESDLPCEEACEETDEQVVHVVGESSSFEEPHHETCDAEDDVLTCSNPAINYTEEEEYPLSCTTSITIVETKAVSVEQVVIPQNENEVSSSRLQLLQQ